MSALSLTVARIDLVERDPPAAARGDALDRFLRGIERRALRMAELATGNRDDALELVQEAMLGFVRRYGAKPAADWAPLFYRVLDSRLLDFHRRNTVRRRWRLWLARDEDEGDPLEQVPDAREPGPDRRVADGELRERLDLALRALPPRQRQAFLLRIWEGLDVADTATAMNVSDGSVKTHLSRALAALRSRLADLA